MSRFSNLYRCAGVSLLSGCLHYQPNATSDTFVMPKIMFRQLEKQAAFEFECSELSYRDLGMRAVGATPCHPQATNCVGGELPSGGYRSVGVSGCGRKGVYVLVPDAGWMMHNGDSSQPVYTANRAG